MSDVTKPQAGRAEIMVPRMTCAVKGCRMRLSRESQKNADGSVDYRWTHGRKPKVGDHDPIPVPDEFVPAILICDFCSGYDPTWLLSCDGVEYERFTAYGGKIKQTQRDWHWAACDECKKLFDAGDIDGVTNRALDTLLVDMPLGAVVRDELFTENNRMHRQFVKGRTYNDRPLTDKERGVGFDESVLSDLPQNPRKR